MFRMLIGRFPQALRPSIENLTQALQEVDEGQACIHMYALFMRVIFDLPFLN